MKTKLENFLKGKHVKTVINGDYVFKTVEHDGKQVVVGARLVVTPSHSNVDKQPALA
ncbi:hypothetical protein [Pseudoalteromonas sp. SK20]|uniref:hypothetical protein n=1 Tax=Pseudoalteromonas sp. SK20 TaxID=1938367 RepID=UPI00158C52F4|nr:hypothetical protein [Pseudoalteromonas sp. SK20]